MHVFDILALQTELRDAAKRLTDDTNEACMLVHRVFVRALQYPEAGPDSIREDLAALARETRRPLH